jgi:hypothetical protein
MACNRTSNTLDRAVLIQVPESNIIDPYLLEHGPSGYDLTLKKIAHGWVKRSLFLNTCALPLLDMYRNVR